MEQNQINLIELNRIIETLTESGWATSDKLFSKEFCKALASECQIFFNKGLFSKASIGIGTSKHTDKEIRGDFTYWLERTAASPLQLQFMHFLDEIQQTLNINFYLGLKQVETHFAFYPPGTGYEKHYDNHKGAGTRRITFILYLNENWTTKDGGELSVFSPTHEDELITTIQPTLGTFMIFRSELFPHQVEKNNQSRMSLTGWFRNDNP